MKFSISNLCLSTLVVAVAIAWAVDRSRSASTLTPQEKLTEAFDLGFAMGSVSGSNRAYALTADVILPPALGNKRECRLIQNVLSMASGWNSEAVLNAEEWRRDAMGRMCKSSLKLLKINEVSSFEKKFFRMGFLKEYEELYATNSGRLKPEIVSFVKAALEKGANETTDSGAKNETDTVKTESKSPE